MPQEILPVSARLAVAPGTTRETTRRARRGRSAGRRAGDKHEVWAGRGVLPPICTPTHESAETMLANRDRMIEIFGHDLRVLLNALTVHAELLLRKEGAAAVETTRNVRRTIGRMDQLIESLLGSVRLNASRLTVVPRPIDAAELLREAVEIFRPLARAKSVSLTLALPKHALRATADHGLVFQVISNLLSNAIKFSSVKGKIAVEATTSARDLQVAVRDEGPGISESDRNRVFEAFCRLQDSDDRGLGLGLYISKAIIEAHGGKIWATSRPGAGSTFSFTIPRSESEPAAGRAPLGTPRC